jgi:hypothetical protein
MMAKQRVDLEREKEHTKKYQILDNPKTFSPMFSFRYV